MRLHAQSSMRRRGCVQAASGLRAAYMASCGLYRQSCKARSGPRLGGKPVFQGVREADSLTKGAFS